MDYLAEFQNFVWLENHPGKQYFHYSHFEWWFLLVKQKRGTLRIICFWQLTCNPWGGGLTIWCAKHLVRKTLDKEPIPRNTGFH